jgi:hypothetical protein
MDNKAQQFDPSKKVSQQEDFEADHNLFAFFDLLLQIDMRNKEKEKTLNHPPETRCVQDQPSEN